MSDFPVDPAAGGIRKFAYVHGWGEVPKADRAVWSRYLVDFCPWFPGASLMTLIARGVIRGNDSIPQPWKDAAAELAGAGFTPLQYYLLAQLLSQKRRRGELNEADHGHLFKKWYEDVSPAFQLDADAWTPWLERLNRAESPRRALDHMLRGSDLPPLGALLSSAGEVVQVATD